MKHDSVIHLHKTLREIEKRIDAAGRWRGFDVAEEILEEYYALWPVFVEAVPVDGDGAAIKLREAARIARACDEDGLGAWLARDASRVAFKIGRYGMLSARYDLDCLERAASIVNESSADLVRSVLSGAMAIAGAEGPAAAQ